MSNDTTAPSKDAIAVATGLRNLATMIEQHPWLAEAGPLRYAFAHMTASVPHRDSIVELARLARRYGAKVNKRVDDDGRWAWVDLEFGRTGEDVYSGRVTMTLAIRREEVCERVVVGTREVVETVPDPEVVAAAPLVQRTRTEEIVEWRCLPLLAPDEAPAVTS